MFSIKQGDFIITTDNVTISLAPCWNEHKRDIIEFFGKIIEGNNVILDLDRGCNTAKTLTYKDNLLTIQSGDFNGDILLDVFVKIHYIDRTELAYTLKEYEITNVCDDDASSD